MSERPDCSKCGHGSVLHNGPNLLCAAVFKGAWGPCTCSGYALPVTPPASEMVDGVPRCRHGAPIWACYSPLNDVDPKHAPASETAEALDDLFAAYEKAACDENSDRWRAEWRRRIEAAIRAESDERVRALREAARGVLSYPGPVNMTEDAHSTCTPDECYVAALRAALSDAAPEDA